MILKIRKRSDTDRNLVISLDGKVWAVLNQRIVQTLYRLGEAGLEREIDEAEREALTAFLTAKSESMLMDYLASAERCESQARNYLKRYQFHPSLIDQAIDKCKTQKYIDDARFCNILIESLIQRRKSRMQIVTKLKQLHIASEIWEPILDSIYLPEEQSAIVISEVAKLMLRYDTLPFSKAREKIISSLFRKGFALDSIIQALEKCSTGDQD